MNRKERMERSQCVLLAGVLLGGGVLLVAGAGTGWAEDLRIESFTQDECLVFRTPDAGTVDDQYGIECTTSLVSAAWTNSYFNNATCRDSRPVERISYYEIRENPANSAIATNWPESTAVHADSFVGRLRAKTGLPFLDDRTTAPTSA
jgi:hypothetical protein